MKKYLKFNRNSLIKSIKIALGGALAIFLAETFGLEYATSAGIIALLTIQDTKRATLRLGAFRVLSFFVAMFFAYAMSTLFGFHALGYGFFTLSLAIVSFALGWGDTLSTNAVFGTHLFMMGKAMTQAFFWNEFVLLILGTGAAILLNLKMPTKEKELQKKLKYTESEMPQILQDIATQMMSRTTGADKRIESLIKVTEDASKIAIENSENTLETHSEFYIGYFELRRRQCAILLRIYNSVVSLEELPRTAKPMADFIASISDNFGIEQDAKYRIGKARELLAFFKKEVLPVTRIEFESRAILFYVLRELETFFLMKQEFLDALTDEQKRLYLTSRQTENTNETNEKNS